ncbi:MAG: EamA family transporter [Treponema sp.]|nr:EamA family transporter [Treponema sp.]
MTYKISVPLMILSAACLCLGQLVWKIMQDYNYIYLIGGFSIYVTGAIAMLIAYRYGELSVLQPINSVSYVFAAIIAIFFLQEKINAINFAGIALIIGGVIIIGTNNK